MQEKRENFPLWAFGLMRSLKQMFRTVKLFLQTPAKPLFLIIKSLRQSKHSHTIAMTVSNQSLIINDSIQETTNPGSRLHCQRPFPSIQTCSFDAHKLSDELRKRHNIFHSLLVKSQNEYSALKMMDTEHAIYINTLRSELLKAECSSRRAQAKAEEAEGKIMKAYPVSSLPHSHGLSVPLRNLFAYERAFKQQEVSDPLPSRSWENSTSTSPSNISLDSLDEILSQTKIDLGTSM